MGHFGEQLESVDWAFKAFCRYAAQKGKDYPKTTSTSDPGYRSLIEEWLGKFGFTFRIDCEPWKGKASYVAYRYGDFVDTETDNELVLLEGLKDLYISCIKSLTNGRT